LTMLSYSEWIEKLAKVGFRRFRSTLTSRLPVVDARFQNICRTYAGTFTPTYHVEPSRSEKRALGGHEIVSVADNRLPLLIPHQADRRQTDRERVTHRLPPHMSSGAQPHPLDSR
jgi:hypothetical protein